MFRSTALNWKGPGTSRRRLCRAFLIVGLVVVAQSAAALPPLPGSHAHGVGIAGVRSEALGVPALTTNTSTLDVGQALNAAVNTSTITGGSGNASNLTFQWAGLPTNCTTENASNYTCFPTATGTFSLSASVTDFSDGQSGTATAVSITVNTDPTVTSITSSAPSVSVNQTVTFTVVAGGGTAPLTYVFKGLPAGCAGNTSIVACKPTVAQEYNVSVTVLDAVGFASNAVYAVVQVTPASTPVSSGTLTTTDWGVIVAILVVGFAITGLLLVRARQREKVEYLASAAPTRVTARQSPPPPPDDARPPPPPGM
ncbi:MAG: hypothetical protein L3K17_07105 [Thermoplasmata archaeon]|nr:hypothetical protein [Thermoplasmata archaeon]